MKKLTFNKYKQTDKEHFMEKVSNGLKISDDILAGAAVISAVGKRNLSIENYKGILKYTDSDIVIQTKYDTIEIKGTKLNIAYYYDYEMRITGNINEIKFIC